MAIRTGQGVEGDLRDEEHEHRKALTAALRERGVIRSRRVERAFHAVDRTVFVPDAPLADVYDADRTHVVARDGDVTVSTVSAPSSHAEMLERAEVRPGQQVLEIGSGGCNAALLAELVAPEGTVRSADIDPRVIGHASDALARHRTAAPVTLEVADAWAPDSSLASHRYDLIQFTVNTWTLPPWLPQALNPGGRVVAPMPVCGLPAAFAFTESEGRLLARGAFPGGFVSARGAGAAVGAGDAHSGDVILVDAVGHSDAWLAEVLADPAPALRTGVELAPGSTFLPFFLWLLCGPEPAASISSASRGAAGTFPGSSWLRTPVWLADGALAVVDGARRAVGPEIVVRGFGPGGEELAQRLGDRVRAWPQQNGELLFEAVPAADAERSSVVDPLRTRKLRRGAWEFRLWTEG